ncbi:MAG: wax ester/triacylglycerol synthase family O-acyltransferase, partial [Myxococcales bacterium]|nr:wax ester/triacylglycerol synthase family O-acyltransferase [Myxococcales bacterium]
RVTSLDAGMLLAETPEMPMHTMGVIVAERPAVPLMDTMRRVLTERIHWVPPFRRRLVEGPLQLGDLHWIEDPDFALDHHLQGVAVRAPGGMRELAEFVGAFAARPLDRSKPLWEVALVEGLEDDTIAIVAKIHHAAMDGGRLVSILGYLFDLSPEGDAWPPPEEAWVPDRRPSLLWYATDTARTLVEKPAHALRAIAGVAESILDGALSGHERAEGARLFEAPPTPFNGALSRRRAVAMADVAFEDVKAIKRAFGATVNDVVLAASCAAARDWLLARDALPDRPLVANVPVTVRARGDDDAGNRVSMILVHLPVEVADPAERLARIRAETARAKEAHGHGGGSVLEQFTDVLTNLTVPWFLTHAVQLYSWSHLADRLPFFWNLVVSNLPGPPVPLYCAGARVLRIYPFGPVQQGSGLNLTVMSTADRLCLGAMACGEMMPDVERIGAAFVEEIALLKGLAAGRG